MNTREFFTLLKSGNICAGFSEPVLTALLNQAIGILGKQEHPFYLSLNEDTGLPPLLETSSGTYVYEAPDDEWKFDSVQPLWTIANILVRYDMYDNYDYELQDYFNGDDNYVINETDYIEIGGRRYLPWYQCQVKHGLEGEKCKIIFSKDPRDTTNKYYVQGYVKPPEITTDRDPIPFPDNRGLHMAILLPAVEALAKGRNNGDMDTQMRYIEQVLRRQMTDRLSDGASGKKHKVSLGII